MYQALEERIGIFSAQSVIDTIARNQKQFTEVGALTHMLIEHQIEWYMLVREQHEKAFSFQLAKSPDHNFVYGSQGKSVARKLGFLERFNRVA